MTWSLSVSGQQIVVWIYILALVYQKKLPEALQMIQISILLSIKDGIEESHK